MKLSVLIVDDEPLAREGLRMLLAEDPEVSAIREARNGIEAIAAIREAPPDLVFLDVQMPEMDGFAVVREIGAESMPSVMFVTAHDRFALQAFDVNAIDYLLKPVTRERFAQGLARAKTRMSAREPEETKREILSLLERIASPHRYVKRLAVRSAGKTLFVNVEQIDWIEAAENYVKLHATRAAYLLHVAMNTLENSLDPEMFLRIHRSFMVNIRRIREMEPALHGEYIITLHNGVRLQSGRHYHAKLKALATNPF
jgi:two-component system LytT family response regulator